MPDKTLKESTFVKTSVDEKVERAKEHISAISGEPGALSWMGPEVEEALTALEKRVEALIFPPEPD